MDDFPRYESYKDSGVEWLGEIPEHWEVLPNRALLSERRERVGKSASEYALLSLTLEGIKPRDMENPKGKFPAEFDTYKTVELNNLIFCLFDIDETPRTVGYSEHLGTITGAYNVYEVTHLANPRFLFYFFLFLDHGKRLRPLYSGLRKTIHRGVFASAKTPLPPKPEQDRIVTFLDRKTSEIDDLIAKKQRQIELLEEQKSILINRAVTQGLNPDVKLKPSGIEWIGNIPEHWHTEKARRLFAQEDRPITRSDEVVTCFRDGQVTLRSKRRTEGFTFAILEQGYQGVEPGDLVIHGMDAFAGAIGVAEDRGKCTPEYIVLNPLVHGIDNRYFALHLREMANSGYIYLICTSVRERAPRFRFPKLKDVHLTVPPIEEQSRIISFVDSVKIECDKASEILRLHIGSLRTLRSTLIAHAVTGSIKV